MKTNKYVFELNTTAYEEENILILTNIDINVLEKELTKLITRYRDEELDDYINEDIIIYINKLYPNYQFEQYAIEYLSI